MIVGPVARVNGRRSRRWQLTDADMVHCYVDAIDLAPLFGEGIKPGVVLRDEMAPL